MAACGTAGTGAAAASLLSPTSQAPGSTGTPVLAECPGNDDELERRQRRRSRAVDLSLKGLGSPALRPEDWQSPLPQWSNEQISEHYSTCIKLSTENKITSKNAFGLHLIDYMDDILKQKNSEPTNFQVAAGTLDASAKIYAVRVDSLHTDTFRVLGHLGKEPAPAKDLDSPEEGSIPGPEPTRKAAPRKKQGFKTVVDPSVLDVPEGSSRPQVDPMFQRALASFDECSAAGVFLTGLRSQSFESRLLFPTELIPLPSSESPALPSNQPLTVPGLHALLAPCVEKRRICSSLAGFRFTNGDEDEAVSALLERFQRSAQVFDPDLEPDEQGWDPAPTEFLPDSPGGDEDDSQEFQEKSKALGTPGHSQRPGAGDIGALSQHVSLRPGEYSYFSPRTLNMWAGPEHWRFRQPPASQPPKDSRRRIPKKPFELDFEADTDFKPYFRKPKSQASITLSKSVVERRNVRNTTLPEDFNYDPRLLEQLFLKPHVRLSQISNPAGTLDSDAGIEDYDYNNPNDTSNFCPALQVPDSDPDSDADPGPDPDVDRTEFPAGAGALPAHPKAPELFGICGGLELIAEPQKVHKIPIQYARTAKRMDMKRLKRNMWELLTETEEGEESEEGPEPKVVGEKMLSDLTKDLQHRLPPAMATNLSVPLAFISLLHLANEKNLQLESTEDLSDVVIKPGH